MATRFQSLSDDDIKGLIAQLVQQIASGVASVSYNGVMTTYSTPNNIRMAIAELEAELVARALAKIKGPRVSPLTAQYPRMIPGGGY